jgi:hypothetical protein
MKQCEGILGKTLRVTETGWPEKVNVRCGQTVALSAISCLDGCTYYACHTHFDRVLARVDRTNAYIRARHDSDEERRENTRRWMDHINELR